VSPQAIDKDAVARNFSEAAGSYDRWASAQAAIADALVARLPAGFDPARIADLGCGTGMLSVRLLARYPDAALVGIDLAEGMIAHCRARRTGGDRATFRVGDAEDPASLPGGVDLVASSCAVQWFVDLPRAIRAWAATLRPGGILALAALVRGTFPELAAAHAAAFGAPFPGLDFPDPGTLADAVRAAGLRILSADPVTRVSMHADAREAFRSFRKIGARVPGRAPLGHGEMRRLIAAMTREGDVSGEVALTHHALVIVAEKEEGCADCS
jgi:malonyl-CoA O-methyltransferase